VIADAAVGETFQRSRGRRLAGKSRGGRQHRHPAQRGSRGKRPDMGRRRGGGIGFDCRQRRGCRQCRHAAQRRGRGERVDPRLCEHRGVRCVCRLSRMQRVLGLHRVCGMRRLCGVPRMREPAWGARAGRYRRGSGRSVERQGGAGAPTWSARARRSRFSVARDRSPAGESQGAPRASRASRGAGHGQSDRVGSRSPSSHRPVSIGAPFRSSQCAWCSSPCVWPSLSSSP
jgi:hypothetical protein